MKEFIQSAIDRRGFLSFSAAAGLASVLGPGRFAAGFQSKAAAAESPLMVLTESPLNAEPPLGALVENWMTPTPLFYVRSHGPNPRIDSATYRLKIEGLVEKTLEFSLAELKERFPQESVTATMTCAGNRRAEFNKMKPVGGVQWGSGAVGNAQWGGAKLSEVLKAAGVKSGAKHVWFEGLDEVPHGEETIGFGGSIPLSKAVADTDFMPGAMLSYEMNGEPLSADHGFPLRSVVPGYIGARSVKWLGRIVVSDRPSPNHYVAGAYKLVTEDTPLAWDEAGVIYNYAVNSVFADAALDAKATGRHKVHGYALPAGDGSHVAKVELSATDGKNWTPAKLLSKPQPYCWVLWQADVNIPENSNRLLVRATDSKGNTQPQTVPWNLKGYMNNSWHEMPVNGKS